MKSRTVFGLIALSLLILALSCTNRTRLGAGQQIVGDAQVQALRQNNLAVAYMNQQRIMDALELFEQAYAADSTLLAPRLNQAIALFHLQRFEEARDILVEFTRNQSDDVRAWYNLGLIYRYLGQPDQAVAAFSQVVRLDADDPDSHYLLGLMRAQLGQYPEAITAYERALELAAYHASAEFGIARAYQAQGQIPQTQEHLARFQEITQQNLSVPMGLAYGDLGPYSLAQDAGGIADRALDPIEVRFNSVAAEAALDFVHNAGPTPQSSPAGTVNPLLGAGACFLDYDADGWMDLFLINGGAEASLLYRNLGNGRFADVTDLAGLGIRSQGMGCTVGDYDNDGQIDLAVSSLGGVTLLRNDGGGGFETVTTDAGIGVDGFPLGLTFIDFDHDGDLDLYVSRFVDFARPEGTNPFDFPSDAQGPGNMLWRNNGNGTFTDWTTETALGGSTPGIGAVGTDLNNDRAIDFVVTGWSESPQVFLNPREGAFDVMDWGVDFPAPSAGVAAADFNKDGWMDLAFTHWASPGLSLWRNVDGRGFEPITLPDLGWERGWGLAPIDYDNDGWVDLAVSGETSGGGEIRVFRNRGTDGFDDVTSAVGIADLGPTAPRALVSADYDNDGDPDLLATQNGGPALLLRNDGGNDNSWLRVDLEGLNDNRSAIGTKVEVFAGLLRQKIEIAGASGYLGQSALPVTAGLGQNSEVDTVRMLWPTGVLQDEVQLQTRQQHTVVEIDRRGSSCPVLFVWNGEEYEFITDVIGAGIAGHWVGPGQRNVSDPTEYVKVSGSSVRSRDGRLSFRLAEPMEELVFLDQVRLLAVDHPSDVDVYPNEYFAGAPPFPEFQVIASRSAHLPIGAWDDAGRNVLPELTERDRRYVIFESAAFKGFGETHSLELDLGALDTNSPVRLLMHGFVDYFTPTSVFAAHQAGVEAILPYVEALDSSGRWVRVMDDLGFPAGLARTMTRDITGRLPEGTERIRITTNLKIYWDQILIDATSDAGPVRLTEVPLDTATLAWRGYPREISGRIRADVTYAYDDVSPTGPYAKHAGNYTRFGDVGTLLEVADDFFVIFGSGEEVALEFDPSGLSELPEGWSRDYFFYADGFEKDMDFYEAYSATVEPLPFHTEEPYPYTSGEEYPLTGEYLEYQLRENTRHQSGLPGPAYRAEYGTEQRQAD